MILGKIISSEGYTFCQKWMISMFLRSFFITCIHKYCPNSHCASKMISIFMIFSYLYGIFWYCEVRSVGSLTLIKSRFGRGVYSKYILNMMQIQYTYIFSFPFSGLFQISKQCTLQKSKWTWITIKIKTSLDIYSILGICWDSS